MLWPFFADLGKTPDRVKPADVLGFVHGIGKVPGSPACRPSTLVKGKDWRARHWRARQDSNLRPSAPEADALSAELQARDLRGVSLSDRE